MNRAVHPLIADLLDKTPTSGDGVETGIEEYPGRPTVYGDRAYGGGEFQQLLTDHSINSGCRSAAPTAPKGRYTKDRLKIDLQAGAVTCPRGVTVTNSTHQDGTGVARFGRACTNCELRNKCTDATGGRTIRVGKHEAVLTNARKRQKTRSWQNDYRTTRPKVERKLAHLMRRQHGDRRGR